MDLEALRASFKATAAWLVELEGWSEEDIAEMGQGIKAAIESGDEQTVQLWAAWLPTMRGTR